MLFLLSWLGICLVGCVLHFTFGLVHHNKHFAWAMAVNESTWEHLKIALIPTFIWGVLMLIFSGFHNIAIAVFVMCVVIAIVMIGVFYGYRAITKKAFLVVDIAIFFLSIAVGIVCAYYIMKAKSFGLMWDIFGYVGDALIFVMLVLFTYWPPKIFLFKDPIINDYGIAGHNEAHCKPHLRLDDDKD